MITLNTILDVYTCVQLINNPSTIEFIIRSRHADLSLHIPVLGSNEQDTCEYIKNLVNANYQRGSNGLLKPLGN